MKAQSSVETIALLAVLLIVFVIVFVLGNSMVTVSSFQSQQLVGQRAVEDIVAIAHKVYLQGNGSREDVFITFPDNLNQTSINGTIVEMKVYERSGNLQTLLAISDVTMQGNLPSQSGTYVVQFYSNGTFVYITT